MKTINYIELQWKVTVHQCKDMEMQMTDSLRAACYQRLNRTNKSALDLVSVEND